MASTLIHTLSYAGFVFAACGLWSLYAAHKLVPQWNRRHFAILRNHWTKIFGISLVIATVMTAVLANTALPGLTPLILGGLTFTLVFIGITDGWISYAPLEVSWFGILWAFLGTIATVIYSQIHTHTFSKIEFIEIALWFVFIGIMQLVVWFNKGKGLGPADFRLLVAAGFSYVWIFGVEAVAVAAILASVVQLCSFGFRAISRRISGIKNGEKTLPYLPALCSVFLIGQLLIAFRL